MKILLQAREVVARRPHWTPKMLARLVIPENKPSSSFSRSGTTNVHFYDMAKVVEAEKDASFFTYQAMERKRK